MRRRPQSLYFSKHGTDLLVRTRVTHAWRHHGLYSTLFTPACLLLRLLWEGRALTCPRLPSCSLNTPRGPQRCPRTLHHMQRSRYSPPHTRNAHLASHTHAHEHARAQTRMRALAYGSKEDEEEEEASDAPPRAAWRIASSSLAICSHRSSGRTIPK